MIVGLATEMAHDGDDGGDGYDDADTNDNGDDNDNYDDRDDYKKDDDGRDANENKHKTASGSYLVPVRHSHVLSPSTGAAVSTRTT